MFHGLVDWRIFALCSIARWLGFKSQHVAYDEESGCRGVLVSTNRDTAKAMAMKLLVHYSIAEVQEVTAAADSHETTH